jgi:hypothetical protein
MNLHVGFQIRKMNVSVNSTYHTVLIVNAQHMVSTQGLTCVQPFCTAISREGSRIQIPVQLSVLALMEDVGRGTVSAPAKSTGLRATSRMRGRVDRKIQMFHFAFRVSRRVGGILGVEQPFFRDTSFLAETKKPQGFPCGLSHERCPGPKSLPYFAKFAATTSQFTTFQNAAM